MPQYKAPLRDIRFLFHDVLDYPAHYAKLPNGAEATPDMVDSILEECAKFCEGVLAPLNQTGDAEGCHLVDGNVTQVVDRGADGLLAVGVEPGDHDLTVLGKTAHVHLVAVLDLDGGPQVLTLPDIPDRYHVLQVLDAWMGGIELLGTRSGYGKYIRIRHNGTLSTAYAHMSRYADLDQGDRVRQGQVIGFVGSTGLSTGAHVHYEILVNGRFVDPMRIKLPRGPRPAACCGCLHWQF